MNNHSLSNMQTIWMGRLRQIKGARNQTIHCLAGCLLITQYGDFKDYVLYPGEQVVVHTNELVLVEACYQDSKFELRILDTSKPQMEARVIDRLLWQLSRSLRMNI